jgi:hypothetical protein
MLAVNLSPVAPAHATYGPSQTVLLELWGGNHAVKLGGVYGSIQFDDQNTKVKWDLLLCRESSYTPLNFWIYVNGIPHSQRTVGDGIVPTPLCRYRAVPNSQEVDDGSVLRNVTIVVEGVYFDGSNATSVRKSATYDNPYN